MATSTLTALIEDESSRHILNRRPPTLDRVVRAVHLMAHSAEPWPHDLCPPDVLWILPVFPKHLHAKFDA